MECVPCHGGTAPLRGAALRSLLRSLGHGWKTVEDHRLEKEFKFDDFKSALAFTNRVGEVAEEQGHHPDIHLAWGRARVVLWTHAVEGLTQNDFILASKIEGLSRPGSS